LNDSAMPTLSDVSNPPPPQRTLHIPLPTHTSTLSQHGQGQDDNTMVLKFAHL